MGGEWKGAGLDYFQKQTFTESQMSLNSYKTVGRGKPMFSSSVQLCVFSSPVTGGLTLGARKMPYYSFVKVFSSRTEADGG